MKKIIYTIIIISIFSCTTSDHSDLKLNKTISESFNESEIRDLQIIFDFFNEQICNSSDLTKNELNECYENYCLELKNQQSIQYEFNPKIDFAKQLQMYSRIEESSFNEIWKFQQSFLRNSKDTLKYLGLNYNGKYKRFLKNYGKENKAVLDYFDSFDSIGDLGPTATMGLLMNYEYYDISDIRTKLIISIQYLTLNDQFYRKEKY